ncbi:MAG: hypothetical protein NBV68_04245 [Erythrobacter sp.]|uniref:hypothetical protein n=1 Tax=Erythrobacter sp. TaxID=1042 RepID=UPI0025FB2F33|nr:hypothetical protein [Erythrobacter sp.]MCL9998568.1 hypothetical protein [Erythrobacter sp.]
MKQILDGAAGAWFSPDSDAWLRDDPITLVTLRLDNAVDDPALQFLANAECEALNDWAARGTLLMALVSHNRRELNLVIACNDDDARARTEDIPSVASEMAEVTVRGVTALTLAGQRKLVTH